MILFKIAR